MNPERLLLILAAAGSCMSSPRMPEPPTSQALAAFTLAATVKIETSDGYGSGFFVNGHTVATARHVMIAALVLGEVPTITTRDGQECIPSGAWIDDDHDLAFVDVSGCVAPNVLHVTHDAEQGAEVMAAGHPRRTDWAVSRGIVAQVSADTPIGAALQITAEVQRGMSGGPVVDERGHLVGIVVGIQSPDGWWAGMGWAVPGGVIAAELTNYNLAMPDEAIPQE